MHRALPVQSVSTSQPSSSVSTQQTLSTTSFQVVYISREKKIKKFSKEKLSDEEKEEDFEDNIRSHLSTRNMTELEKTGFIFFLLESPAGGSEIKKKQVKCEIYTLTLKVHDNNKVKEMQYEILNNYLPTNSWLKKI